MTPRRLIMLVHRTVAALDLRFYVEGKFGFDLEFTGNGLPIALQNVYRDYVD
jgi:hypothetical protein